MLARPGVAARTAVQVARDHQDTSSAHRGFAMHSVRRNLASPATSPRRQPPQGYGR